MLRYYARLSRCWPRVFRESWERVAFLVDVALAALLLFNQPLAQAAGRSGFSVWWFLLPLMLLFIYGTAKANWELYVEHETDLSRELTDVRGQLAGAEQQGRAHEERLRPKLRLRFDGRTDTYYQEVQVVAADGTVLNDRLFRVAIVNESTAIIEDVHVLLEGCTRHGNEAVFPNHRLHIMGREDSDTIDVPPGSQPSVFVDVVEQQEPVGAKQPGPPFICYSNPNIRGPLLPISRTMTLVAQGGGTEARINLQLMRGSDGRLQLVQMAGES
jgi:hypothetical protein